MKPVRAHARRLVIANWRGNPFYCFDMDRHLTGFEGANGSGKTTAMAAYVTAILPNQRLLHFPLITGAGDAKADPGLWGRLGDEGSIYTIIEWALPRGSTLWAGVHMVRGAAPSIEMKTFTIVDLPDSVDPYKAFLVREGERTVVPQLSRLAENVAMHGGRLNMHRTLADYMRTLFERGITPMPMTSHDEQERFYRVLSASMAGASLGILAKNGLRDYLLVEDSGVERRVQITRNRLEECRITKRELAAAQAAHAEIHGLFEKGWEMASYAYFGALGRFEQETQAFATSANKARRLRADHTTKKSEVESLQEEVRTLESRLEDSRNQVEQAKGERDRAHAARVVRRKLDIARVSLQHARFRLEETTRSRDVADEQEKSATREEEMAQREHSAIAEELSNVQQAYEQLTRRVNLFRSARQRLAQAQAALPQQTVDKASARPLKSELDRTYQELTNRATTAAAELDALTSHKTRFQALLGKLRAIVAGGGQDVPEAENAYERALALDTVRRSKQTLAAQVEQLQRDLAETRKLAIRQEKINAEAVGLGIDSSERLNEVLDELNAKLLDLDEALQQSRSSLSERQQQQAESESRITLLDDAARRFEEAENLRNQLRAFGSAMADCNGVAALNESVQQQRRALEATSEARRAAERELVSLSERISNLESGAGTLDPRIGSVAAHVDGHLLAARFDALEAEEAAIMEARLGPWTEAIVVDSPSAAALHAAQIEDRPEHLLFIAQNSEALTNKTISAGDSEIVEDYQGDIQAVRLSRKPRFPVLGRRARELEIARLKQHRELMQERLSALREQYRVEEQALGLAEALRALGSHAWGEDPRTELVDERTRLRAIKSAITGLHDDINRIQKNQHETVARKRKVLELEPSRQLLDAPVYKEREEHISAALETAAAATQWVLRNANSIEALLQELPILARVPDETAQCDLQQEVKRLNTDRGTVLGQIDALSQLLTVIEGLDYAADEAVFEQQSSVLVALRARSEPARERVGCARQALSDARAALDAARTALVEVGAYDH